MVEAMFHPQGRVLSSVNKKEVFSTYLRLLEARVIEVRSSIDGNRQVAIDAPGMMQSRSDTSKAQYSWLVNALLIRLKLLNETMEMVGKLNLEPMETVGAGAIVLVEYPDYSKRIFAISCGSEPADFEFYNIKFQFISISAPLAREMIGKRVDCSFVFKGASYDILEVV